MLDFGDELIIESSKIPWLIWIHLLVTILFIILIFFGFTIFTSNFSQNPSISMTSASPSTSNTSQSNDSNQNSSSQRTKVNENQRIKRDEGTSGQTTIEEVQECKEYSLNDPIFFRLCSHQNHPCNYLGLAKQALLKCFGLDSRTKCSSNEKLKNED